MTDDDTRSELLALTADIVTVHVENNVVPAGEVAALISSVHAALAGLGRPPMPAAPPVARRGRPRKAPAPAGR